MKIYLIRHGKTPGNLENRYVGRTDESLSGQGAVELLEGVRNGRYPKWDRCTAIVSSPMKRCLETSALLFPGCRPEIAENLRECDFGAFEYRNYHEMNHDPAYNAWVAGGGTGPFPGGEAPEAFRARSVQAFLEAMNNLSAPVAGSNEPAEARQPAERLPEQVIFVVHGGTIMAVMAALASPEKEYFEWQLPNGSGVVCDWDPAVRRLRWIRNL
ncbi:MAG: histidine phosphatase family protein [Firmicutes bacterium]|nr:histidine phosphatase family protein [Bacillota bacterium]